MLRCLPLAKETLESDIYQYSLKLSKFISEFEWLSDFFAIDFLTTDWYENHFPKEWRSKIPFDLVEICNIVKHGHMRPDWPDSLKDYVKMVHSLGLKREVMDFYSLNDNCLEKDIMIGMNSKKVQETTQLSKLIHDTCKSNAITNILDLGCGQGYLSTVLAFQYNYEVVGWDADSHQTIGATQRAARISNLLKRRGKTIHEGCLEFMTERIEWDDLKSIFKKIFDSFPEKKGKKYRYILCPQIGCCYHLLTEKGGKDWSSRGTDASSIIEGLEETSLSTRDIPFGFPMSRHLNNCTLGLHNRMVACQAPKQWDVDKKNVGLESIRRLFYRSVLESVMKEYNIHPPTVSSYDALKATGTGERAIKKMGVKECTDPVTYTKAALKRLGCSVPLELTDAILIAHFEWHVDVKEQIAEVWALRCMLGDVIEALVLVDRCLYVIESGFKVDLVSICDPSESPRNMAVVIVCD